MTDGGEWRELEGVDAIDQLTGRTFPITGGYLKGIPVLAVFSGDRCIVFEAFDVYTALKFQHSLDDLTED